MKPEIYRIETSMGKINSYLTHPLTFLSPEEQMEFDNIGYSGKKFDGVEISRDAYLNSLGKGHFTVKQVKFDKGDFSEEFIIARVVEVNEMAEKLRKMRLSIQDPETKNWVIDCSEDELIGFLSTLKE